MPGKEKPGLEVVTAYVLMESYGLMKNLPSVI